MSAAIAELIQAGLVEPIGAVQGGMGRRAVEYRVATHAGHVIAVDAGSTHIRLRLSTLDRRLLHSSLHPLPQSQYALTPQISAVVAAAVAGLWRGPRPTGALAGDGHRRSDPSSGPRATPPRPIRR
ncbi:hypothetical protein ACTTAL_19510 (plasmid) [Rhodobacter capsulatus]